jgi:acyl-CoA thioesterase-1
MKQPSIIILFSVALIFISCSRDIKIACVGDSITEGVGLMNQSRTAYPVMLDSILGPGYTVMNCGRSAATLQKEGDLSYWDCKEFYDVFAFNPDIIVIKLGTNDTKIQNWNYERFIKDYQALIDTFNQVPAKPKIFVCLPVPVFKTAWGINDSTLTAAIIPIIKETAAKNNLAVIDLYHQMSDQQANFPDDIHPNEKGAKIMAGIIAKEIKKQTTP